jgi:hypothetical protein
MVIEKDITTTTNHERFVLLPNVYKLCFCKNIGRKSLLEKQDFQNGEKKLGIFMPCHNELVL